MARIWPIEPTIPNPQLLERAGALVDQAREFVAATTIDEPLRLSFDRLGHTLAIWSISVERMATTGPGYHGNLARQFADHPQFGADQDPLARHKAMADLWGFVATGDRVLTDLARSCLLANGRDVPPAVHPWSRLLRLADDETMLTAGVRAGIRRLQVSLRDARHRLLAHPNPTYGDLIAWERDDSLVIHQIPPEITDVVRAELLDIAQLVEPPLAAETPLGARDLLQWVVRAAPRLRSGGLERLSHVMRQAGYTTFPVRQVISDVLVVSRSLPHVEGEG